MLAHTWVRVPGYISVPKPRLKPKLKPEPKPKSKHAPTP